MNLSCTCCLRFCYDFLFLHRSKSTSDLPVNPSILRQLSYEEMEKFREQQKANDDVWEDVSTSGGPV